MNSRWGDAMTLAFKLTPEQMERKSAEQRRGAKANRAGSNFQKAITWSAGIQREVVELEELPPFGAKRITGGKTVFLPICCDFVGALVDCCGLFFDAKSCGPSAVSLNLKTMILHRPHQLEFLRGMARAKQIAGYLVECCSLEKYLWLDVKHIIDDGPIRFQRDGVLCRQWLDLGPTTLMVNFKNLLEAYYK